MAENESLGERLRRLRKRQGLTLAQLAENMQLSLKTIQRWEQSKYQPRTDEVNYPRFYKRG